MMNRFGLDRFKKATSAEPFSVTQQKGSAIQQQQPTLIPQQHYLQQFQVPSLAGARLSNGVVAPAPVVAAAAPGPPPGPVVTTAFGAGGSTWQPPDWATEPKSLVYWLDVMKDGEVVDKITLDRKRLIFGRQHLMCDLVLDHPSVSRQHAAVVLHKNGGIYVIDLGSVHGTFVANERLTKDNPVELEVGQSLRFAASTRSYVLRKNVPTPVVPPPPPTDIVLPPAPDPSDEEAVLAYNTALNRLGVPSPLADALKVSKRSGSDSAADAERPKKKARNSRVSFRDDYGGSLAEVVGISDGADVSTEPGPVGVREGSLVGKYESLVQVTVIPKGQEEASRKAESGSSQGVTERLKQYLDKVKSPGKGGGLYGDMYGESLGGIAGGSWATVQTTADNERTEEEGATNNDNSNKENSSNGTVAGKVTPEDLPKDEEVTKAKYDPNDDDDLFGDDEDS
ncbi:unnamed protein product [Calypogeia fissa]